MSREQTLALVRQLLYSAGQRNTARLMELYGDDPVAISPVVGEVRGRAAVEATWQALFSTLGNVAIEVTDVLVDGDRVVVLSTIGTNRLVLLLTLAGGKVVRDERIVSPTI